LKDLSCPIILQFGFPLLDLMKMMLFHYLVNTEVEEAEGLVFIGPAIEAAHAVLAHRVIEILFLLLV
jgi:hypothetical protein